MAAANHSDLSPYLQIIQSLAPYARAVTVCARDGAVLAASEPKSTAGLAECIGSVVAHLRTSPDGRHIDSRLIVGGAVTYLVAVRDPGDRPLGVALLQCDPARQPSDMPTVDALLPLLSPVLCLLARELDTPVQAAAVAESAENGEAPESSPTGPAARDIGMIDVETLAKRANAACASVYIPAAGVDLTTSYPDATPADIEQLRRITIRHLFPQIAKTATPMIVNKIRESAGAELVPSRMLCVPLRRRDLVVGLVTIYNPRHERPFEKDDETLLRRLAKALFAPLESAYDEATGLLTRQAFESTATARLNGQSTRSRCVVYGDMDRLHAVNELFGFARGDEVLRSVAKVWSNSSLPAGSLVCRLSGDRFVALLEGFTLDQGHTWAEYVRKTISAITSTVESSGLNLSASFGIASLPADKSLNYALAASETACQAAKDRGRNRIELFADTDASLMQRHDDLHVFRDLVDALDAGRFCLFAQPLCPLADPGQPVHYEVLVRLIDANNELVLPGKFLSAATRYQLLPRLDRWVITHVLAKLHEFRDQIALHSTVFWINLTGQSLAEPEFLEFVRDAVRDSGLPAGSIGFEITENAAIGNLEQAQRFMSRLRELGCRFALDDFGTGLSSLKYLKDLRVSMLKIDGSFIRDVLLDPRSESLVRAVLNVASELGLETTAEWIESPQVAEHLTDLGVSYGQGYALGRPGSMDELLNGLWRHQQALPDTRDPTNVATALITANG